jgi:hypothetical protein
MDHTARDVTRLIKIESAALAFEYKIYCKICAAEHTLPVCSVWIICGERAGVNHAEL